MVGPGGVEGYTHVCVYSSLQLVVVKNHHPENISTSH